MLSIIQARMSSARLPGKMLMDICGRTLLGRVIDQVKKAECVTKIVIATSTDPTDLEIADFCDKENVELFQGSLTDVASRYLEIAQKYGEPAFIRVCGDSPLIDPQLIDQVARLFNEKDCDIATNTFPRTFPKGQSVEVVDAESFHKAYLEMTTPDQKEHVTKIFYDNFPSFKIFNLNHNSDLSSANLSVDSLSDLIRVREIIRSHEENISPWEKLVRQ